ncbi:hypothetical protein [Myxococcus sp. AS-1-15]|nr:hypothetical protein [Myxococcus sp. AS-1-15]
MTKRSWFLVVFFTMVALGGLVHGTRGCRSLAEQADTGGAR